MASLRAYNAKRNFSATPEPEGNDVPGTGYRFVVQKHAARRLHYDFRLEMDGVLKSWAVTRGPSLVPGEKRLAVHVEDHPLAYADFEGRIPKGEYGGGSVIVWDRGTWMPLHDPHEGFAKGHLDFELYGSKLKGRWHLVQMHGKAEEKRDNWLLIKGDDSAARTPDEPDILQERPESVKTGRDIREVTRKQAEASPKSEARYAQKAVSGTGTGEEPVAAMVVKGGRLAPLPDFVAPMLATLVKKPPSGSNWLHEIKFDGYRLLARIDNGEVRLLTRGALDWTMKFGEGLVTALKGLPVSGALIDGELVVENGVGASDFSALQAALSEGRTDRFLFYGFDLLHLDGYDLRETPLINRKERLAQVIENAPDCLRLSRHFDEKGALVLEHACRLSLEGIISKRRNSFYRSGRGKDWVKAKCSARQEFVIGGYVPSTVRPDTIGSLVLGYYEGDRFVYAGRVGTGFTHAVADDLYHRLAPLAVKKRPFAEALSSAEARHVYYVRPELVVEVEFPGWTADHRLRHASFRGIREDKLAQHIIRESAADMLEDTKPQKRTVTLTHPERLYWPDAGVTKEGLADYYAGVWRFIAPFITGRPLALLRCPEGIDGPRFFQKHAWKKTFAHIRLIEDPKEASDPLLMIEDIDGLLELVQSAVLEIHPWGSTIRDWDHPDMIVMDLDPGDEVAWPIVIDAAREVRERLQAAGLAAFVKTSGGKGLHVAAPLTPRASWPAVKAFTKSLASAMAADTPDRYVATLAKSKREGHIFIDYLRNQRGMTAVAPYSTRAWPGAPVSMPLAWDELCPEIGAAHYTLANTPERLAERSSDPWGDFRAAAVPLEVVRKAGKQKT